MRPFILFVCSLCSLLALISCNKPAESSVAPSPVDPNYDIQLRIEGAAPSRAYLSFYQGDAQSHVLVDSVEGKTVVASLPDSIKEQQTGKKEFSQYIFRHDSSLKRGLYVLSIPSQNTYLDLVVNNDQSFLFASDTSDLIKNLNIEGSRENSFYYDNIKRIKEREPELLELQQELLKAASDQEKVKEISERYFAISKELLAMTEKQMDLEPDLFAVKMMKAGKMPDFPKGDSSILKNRLLQQQYIRSHFWDNIDFSDDRLLRTTFFTKKLDTYIDYYVPQQADSLIKEIDRLVLESKKNQEVFRFVLEHFFNKYAQRRALGQEAVYVHILDTYYVSGKAFWANKPES